MPGKSKSEFTAGIFVVTLLVVAMGVVLWLGAADVLRSGGQLVSFYVPQHAGPVGISEGAKVKYGDADIGRIVDVAEQTDKGRCIYRARIDRRDIIVRSDGKAMVTTKAIGSAELVILAFGESDALADDDNPILLSGGLDQAMTNLVDTTEKLKAIADRVLDQLDPADSQAALGKVNALLNSLKSIATNLSTISANVLAQTDPNNDAAMLASLRQSAVNVRAMTEDARPKLARVLSAAAETAETIEGYSKKDLGEILATLRQSNTQILKIANDFADVSAQARQIVVLNRDNIDEFLDNLTQASANLKSASKEIRRNPWRLLHKPDKAEVHSTNVYEAARSFSEGAEQLDQAIAKLTAVAKLFPQGLPADDPQVKKIREHVKKAFESFTKAEKKLWDQLK